MARVVSVEGVVEVRRGGTGQWVKADLSTLLYRNDVARVGANSRAALRLANDANLRLDQLTTITFTGVEREKTLLMNLVKGAVHFFSRFPRSLKVVTPFVNGTVEGTEFAMRVEDDRTSVSVFKGKVRAANPAGKLLLARGQTGVAVEGAAPVLHPVARPRDAAAWGLYYPVVARWDRASDIVGSGSPVAEWVTRSLDAYEKNDIPAAIKALSDIPQEGGSATLQAYRASLYLTVGRVEKADAHIRRSLFLSPENPQALALKSVLLLVGNQKDEALSVAERAVAAHPKSAAARMAQSYALQAHFRLEEALAALEPAAADHPDSARIFARMAELKLSLGDVDGALADAGKAAALQPDLPSMHSVLGYVYLVRNDMEKARASFEKAISLDSAAPLPRLGLGLAVIRGGDLEGGRQQIEIASGMDSANALIRSYLGKAYFDETRDGDAADQYEIAKTLDPNDPTPWFYDALAKQAANRPVEALANVQRSIELNDHRAVYRSRLMLDQDLAVRSAGLANMYRDLGFEQLALAEGWKSAARDPASAAAHRFLADTYSALPNHDIARVSELLQSQLRQPLNVNPVPPHLAETDLFIFENAGPASPSVNEVHPLFLRNRTVFQGSSVVGGDDTFGEEIVVSGVADKVSYSVGQFHYETDGFRENNGRKQDIANGFVQAQLSPRAGLQAEVRTFETGNGDLSLRFDPQSILSTLDTLNKTRTFRLGGRYLFRPETDLLFSVIATDNRSKALIDNDLELQLPFPIGPVSTRQEIGLFADEKGVQAELQLSDQRRSVRTTAGAGVFTMDSDSVTSIGYLPQVPPLFSDDATTESSTTDHASAYTYALIDFAKRATLVLGGSYDHFRDTQQDQTIDRFNPKLGLLWEPAPATTVRAAFFRTLKRPLAANQTLEPTQVAGFNQFYDDANGTRAERYGLGIDRKWVGAGVYGGAEASRRTRTVPYTDVLTGDSHDGGWTDEWFRAYLYWTPKRWLALSAEMQLERTERDENLSRLEDVAQMDTTRVPLGVRMFLPNGFSTEAVATYVHQEGRFGNPASGFYDDSSHFWVTDVTASYRFPKRRGRFSLTVKNLFNQSFRFQDTDPRNPSLYPDRLILARFTLGF